MWQRRGKVRRRKRFGRVPAPGRWRGESVGAEAEADPPGGGIEPARSMGRLLDAEESVGLLGRGDEPVVVEVALGDLEGEGVLLHRRRAERVRVLDLGVVVPRGRAGVATRGGRVPLPWAQTGGEHVSAAVAGLVVGLVAGVGKVWRALSVEQRRSHVLL